MGGHSLDRINRPMLVCEAIQQAFDRLDGVDGLVAWIKGDEAASGDNRKFFYTQLWPKLLPLEAKSGGDADPIVEVRTTIIDAAPGGGPIL